MSEPIEPGLRTALERLARVPRLLVASDYDGVLAPIVTDPAQAVPLPAAVTTIRALAALPDTTAAVVSGRALRDLATLSRLPGEVHLVGSHGSEFESGFGSRLAPDQTALRSRLQVELQEIVEGRPGVRLEAKPISVAVHTRTAARDVAAEVAEAVWSGPAAWPGVHVTTGKEVIELAVIDTNKGTALDTLRARVSAGAVLFMGDDVTDENAFARLRDTDVGVKIGPGDTRAEFRVAAPEQAVQVLGLLLRLRQEWLSAEPAVPESASG